MDEKPLGAYRVILWVFDYSDSDTVILHLEVKVARKVEDKNELV